MEIQTPQIEQPSFDLNAFFGALQPKTKIYPVPGFGDVMIKGLTSAEHDAVNKRCPEADRDSTIWAYLVVECVRDLGGNKVLTDEHIPLLKSGSVAGVNALSREVLIINGFLKDESEKNSPATPESGSSSV